MTRTTDDRSVAAGAAELKDLLVAYAKQETLEPLKALKTYVVFGVAGALLLAVGTAVGAIAVLRAVQTEAAPHLTGDLSWVPYLGAALFALLVAGFAISGIARRK
ncbi:MAG TPA: hypothetical protein VFP61_16060 [Acidimicrobiales bacterium]|nr:hypothetical protein [Acidimicrobiales bacterium]